MQKFISENFMLGGECACKLYNEFARDLPIIDFHSHLSPREVAEDAKWDNIAQIWLGGDHYKWRAMRSAGVDEKFITGNQTSDKEKFFAFAKVMPKMLRNPMYHWCHLELARYFGIDDVLLSSDTAEEVWSRANEVISGGNFSARTCLNTSKVEVACTTDDPCDTLEFHRAAALDKSLKTKLYPTFRPDKALTFENGLAYAEYVEKLSKVSGIGIFSFSDLIAALKRRHDYFEKAGCRCSDYGLSTIPFASKFPTEHLDDAFVRALDGAHLTRDELVALKSEAFLECSRMDYDSGWVRQIHIGPMRNNNSRMMTALGADTGFDSIGESNYAQALSSHLDTLDSEGKLSKTILYNINPKDTEMLATMLGNFQSGECAGKIQLGAAWWFLDQKDGIQKHIEAVSAMSLLPCFVGMLTDSRSFLSYPRHEYFRRILCNMFGRDMESGALPMDFGIIGDAVKAISHDNAKAYFKF